jgi:hypothetical protein
LTVRLPTPAMLVVAPTAPAGTTIVTPSTTNWVTVLLSPGSLSVSLVRTLPLTGVSSGVLAVSGVGDGGGIGDDDADRRGLADATRC